MNHFLDIIRNAKNISKLPIRRHLHILHIKTQFDIGFVANHVLIRELDADEINRVRIAVQTVIRTELTDKFHSLFEFGAIGKISGIEAQKASAKTCSSKWLFISYL